MSTVKYRFRSLFTACLLAACVWGAGTAWALDLGAVGPVHQITEVNAIELIKARLAAMQKSGELAKWEEDSKKRIVDGVRNPAAVAGVMGTKAARTFYYDPTYTVPKDILTPDGKLMYPAGFKVNPLQVSALSQHLLFFDGRDKRQVKYAQELIQHYEGRVKPILVGGSPFDLMRDWKLRVFFDQRGMLSTRFGITQVPALVSQEGMMLRVDELIVPAKG